MCRLFGLTAGTARVGATFWLLGAPDSLVAQSHRNVDGSGIGFFDSAGAPVLDKEPEPAFSSEEFLHEAKQARSATFVAHVRFATAGPRSVRNTHPFAMHGRIMAHNGGFGELARLDERLGPYGRLVLGDTDSERYFALITQQADAHGGDVGAGIAAAARWIAANLPVSSLNTIVTTADELWALRYPDQHALHVLDRPPGPSDPPRANGDSPQAPSGPRAPSGPQRVPSGPPEGEAAAGPAGSRGAEAGLHVRSTTSSVHMPGLDAVPSVVVASERLDGETGWRMLAPGELVHVRAGLGVESAVVIDEPPRRLVPIGAENPNIDT